MQNFFFALLICSATMSAIALFYMAITPLLAKRYSAKWRYYAWLIIVIGLIIPFRPHFDATIITVDMPAEAATPIVRTWNGTPDATPSENAAIPPASPSITWEQITAEVWLTGVIGVLAYHAIRHYRFMKMVGRWSKEVTDERSCGILRRLTIQMGISQTVKVQECSCIPAPMMIGFCSPIILLPKVNFSDDELGFILKHELVHWGRKDLWYKCAVLATTAMHWFNPVVYLMSKEISAQCELSCDEKVLQSEAADARQQYCETIIGMIRNQCKVKTALSTNFYGGTKGMKKRIFSIMDTAQKKSGFAIICGALILTFGTGMAFAANPTASALQENVIEQENALDRAAMYERYEQYSLTYDKTKNLLHYKGELVRYFEDWYPFGDGGSAGADYINENGTIDVHAVRDLSQLIHNADGSYDPSGKLIGVEPYSQAEFDARDINKLKNPPQAITMVANGNDSQYPVDPYNGGSNFMLSGESKEDFKKYAEFGLTYDDDNVFRYNGKAVRRFADAGGALSFSRSVENDYDKSVDLTAIRDANGKLTGMSVANKEEFDQRTARMEQSQKEWDEFLKNNPNVTSYSAVDGGYNPSANSNNSGALYSNPNVTGITSDEDSAGSYSNSDYVDTSLNAYLDYGVSYDKTGRAWVFNCKPIDFLIDTGHQVYMNFSADNTDSNFAKTVEASNGVYLRVTRKSNGEIEKAAEMTVDEAVRAINAVFNLEQFSLMYTATIVREPACAIRNRNGVESSGKGVTQLLGTYFEFSQDSFQL